MRLNQLQLTNFRQHVNTRIDFETGLTGIIGPNGSGKTTILEAIAWALYGMPAARGTREGIRSLRAPARSSVRVELDFDLAGHRYHVVRSLSSAELFLDGASSPIANSITAVTDLLRRRLGMSQQEFFNTYFTGQKELSVMAAMGPAERAQFLSRVLGYEKLRGAQALVRERRNVIRGELAGVQSAMPESEVVARLLKESDARLKDAQSRATAALGRLKKVHEQAAVIEPKWKEAQRERDAMQKLESELRVRVSEENALARDAERLESELAQILEARREIQTISAELNVHTDLAAQLRDMERLFREEGRRQELVRGRQTVEQELATLRERGAALGSSKDAVHAAKGERDHLRAALSAALDQEEAARTEWVRDRQEVLTKREALLAQHKDVRTQRERLADLGPESPCPICTRPLKDHFREVLDELDGKLQEIEIEGKYFRKRLEQLEEMPTALAEITSSVRSLEAEMERATKAVSDAQLRAQAREQVARDIEERERRLAALVGQIEAIPAGYHATRHAQLTKQHAELSSMQDRAVRLSALAEREPRVKKDIERAHKEGTRVRKQIATLRERQAVSSFSDKSFVKLKASHDAAAAELRTSELAALGAEKELEAAKAARAAADASRIELERGQERLRALTMDRRLHEELDRAFTDMRTELNQHLRPEISELASGFLSDLTDGRYSELELDDDYNIIVLEDGIPKPVISGGEDDLANLVLRLAISQMIAERAGQAFSLLILDEVFGSLDETRRHNVVELLRRLHDRFEQAIVITHIESVREGLDRVLTVRYDEESGSSRVIQESGGALLDEGDTTDEYAAAGAG